MEDFEKYLEEDFGLENELSEDILLEDDDLFFDDIPIMEYEEISDKIINDVIDNLIPYPISRQLYVNLQQQIVEILKDNL